MTGISPKLPLTIDYTNGYELNQTFQDSVKQNLAGLVLTVPGERIMDPDFGVGLRTYLFEIDNPLVRSDISGKLTQQVGIYIPWVNILEISFTTQKDNPELEANFLYMSFTYIITPLDFTDRLDITLPIN
jgi:phage baseplate assembly protein W|tara:strand:- start:6604 stop:6993 length:390 start_codon:yes stop_codon:yes gene_type:complete